MEKGLEWVSEGSPLSTRRDIIRWWEARRYHFNLTFGEYVRLLQNPKQWTTFAIQIDRKTFTDELRKVGDIRNDVMHFHPDGIGPEDLTLLRKFARFLSELEKKLA